MDIWVPVDRGRDIWMEVGRRMGGWVNRRRDGRWMEVLVDGCMGVLDGREEGRKEGGGRNGGRERGR